MTDFTVQEPQGSLLYGEIHTWRMQIRDGTGTRIDPTSQQVTVQVTDPTEVIKLSIPTYATRSGTGLYYYSYTLPAIGPAGVWKITFTYTIGTDTPIHTRKFVVDQIEVVNYAVTPTTITVSWMRGYMDNISEALLSTSTLAMYILKDELYINTRKSPVAPDDIITWAKITRIAFHAYGWYTSQHERTFSEEENINNRQTLAQMEAEAIDWELLALNASSEEFTVTANSVAAVYGKSVSTRIT